MSIIIIITIIIPLIFPPVVSSKVMTQSHVIDQSRGGKEAPGANEGKKGGIDKISTIDDQT